MVTRTGVDRRKQRDSSYSLAMAAQAPDLLRETAERVEHRLETLLASERDRWQSLAPELAVPFAEIERLVMAGGKRLRPALCHLGFVALGGSPSDSRQIDAGAAIEMLHVCALFHDDIMDGAATRRGEPTAHVRFADEHLRNGWSGESRRFGEGASLLVGDLAFALSDVLLGDVHPAVRAVWHELRLEVNVGQYLDVLGAARGERRVEIADLICRFKSGKYTIERPLHIGALIANPGAPREILAGLSAYGLPLGDAFQMRDDVLGAIGDPDVTGKPVGDDLREGKPTPLLARAVRRADAGQRAVLETVGRPGLDDAGIARIQQVLHDTGAVTEVEQLIDERRRTAVEAIASLGFDGEVVDQLVALAEFITDRRV